MDRYGTRTTVSTASTGSLQNVDGRLELETPQTQESVHAVEHPRRVFLFQNTGRTLNWPRVLCLLDTSMAIS